MEGHEEECVACTSPRFRWFAGDLWRFLGLCVHLPDLCLHFHTHLCVWVSVQISPFREDTSIIGLEAHLSSE